MKTMVEAGGRQLARFLGGHKKLVLSYDWEDQDWLDPTAPRTGTLPGEGYTSYMMTVSPIDERNEWDEGDALEEFHFCGGSEVIEGQVPPEVEDAFESWYAKLRLDSAGAGLTIRFVGSAGTEDAVDKLLDAIESASPHLPVWVAELGEGRADKERTAHETLDLVGTKGRASGAHAGTTRADSESRGRFKDARVKGFSLRMHQGGEEMPIAFVDHGDRWMLSGTVKTQPAEFPSDEAKLIWLFDVMMHQGVDLSVTDD